MGPAYEMLGLTVAHVTKGMSADERRRAYAADVTYSTLREVGYDLLRDGLAVHPRECTLRPFQFALVDEADSLLIDEARVPLVIAGAEGEAQDAGREVAASLVRDLEAGRHFQTDTDRRNVFLTDEGRERVQDLLACGDLHDSCNRDTATLVQQALHAHALLARDVDYVVRGSRIEIVDEFTGRVAIDRHWPDGLHTAVEVKEGLGSAGAGHILGSITIQHVVGIYPFVCAMTGTVLPSDHELKLFYGLETTVIPPHLPCRRVDRPDLLFAHVEDKHRAVVADIAAAHETGRPVLVGTASIAESLELSRRLREAGVPCRVLNAINDEEEAAIVSEAGVVGAVTISTNMAGRGTDIRLGGTDEASRDQVIALGGLYVIGTNRFESRRIDDQLRGRAGRQGDPGESRFFVSLEDDLLVRHGLTDLVPRHLFHEGGGEPLTHRLIHDKIAITQRNIEWQNLQIRRTAWDYGSFVESQRRLVSERRQRVLLGEDRPARELAPERHAALADHVTADVLDEVERRIALFHIDRGWADHLAAMADIREGIHLSRLGGRNPLHEYLKLAVDAFDHMEAAVEDGIKDSFERAGITSDGIDFDKEGLRGPSSTWTYLVNDNPFEWTLGLSAPGNMGLGIAAGFLGGLFVLRALHQRIKGRPGLRREEQERGNQGR
jgi:preprotein translocase subunit SecA